MKLEEYVCLYLIITFFLAIIRGLCDYLNDPRCDTLLIGHIWFRLKWWLAGAIAVFLVYRLGEIWSGLDSFMSWIIEIGIPPDKIVFVLFIGSFLTINISFGTLLCAFSALSNKKE